VDHETDGSRMIFVPRVTAVSNMMKPFIVTKEKFELRRYYIIYVGAIAILDWITHNPPLIPEQLHAKGLLKL
jgi:hypothetical protein